MNIVNPPIIVSLRKSSFPGASTMTFLLFFIGLLPTRRFGVLLRICFVFSLCCTSWNVFRLLKCLVVQLRFRPKYISETDPFEPFSSCSTKLFDTPDSNTPNTENDLTDRLTIRFGPKLCIMDFAKNYLYWLTYFLLTPNISLYTHCSQRQKPKIHLQIADTD